MGVALRPLPSLSNFIPGFHGQDLKAQPRLRIVSNLGALGADDVVWFVYLVNDLQHALKRLIAECEAARMRISISKRNCTGPC